MQPAVEKICQILEQGPPAVLATVVACNGSTPRRLGARMLVYPDGTLSGSLGGGAAEARVIAAAGHAQADGRNLLLDIDLAGGPDNEDSMSCGGHLAVLVESLAPNPAGGMVWRAFEKLTRTPRAGHMITRIQRGRAGDVCIQRWVLQGEDVISGSFPLQPAVLSWLQQNGLVGGCVHALAQIGGMYLVEPAFAPGTIYLCGAGHVAAEIAPLTARLGFRTVVLDDREMFANRSRFPQADEIVILKGFEGGLATLPVDADSYVVVATRGHAHDLEALRQALRTPAGYIGMLGSRVKRDRILEILSAEGLPAAELARVHSPIGLAIGAETPAEIAVSVAAELIQARHALRRGAA